MLNKNSDNKRLLIATIIVCLVAYFYFFSSKNLSELNISETEFDVTTNSAQHQTVNLKIDEQTSDASSPASFSITHTSITDEIVNSTEQPYIVDCTEMAFEYDKKQDDIIEQQFNDYQQNLTQSQIADHQYVAIISRIKELSQTNENDTVADDENISDEANSNSHTQSINNIETEQTANNNLYQLYQLVQKYPLNKLYYIDLLQQCTENFDEKICNQALFEQANLVDNNNAALWHNIAVIKQQNNDVNGAIDALIQANKKTQYNNYDYNKLQLVEQTLNELSTLNYQTKFLQAWGVFSAFPSALSHIFSFCRENMITNPDANINHQLADICYQVGVQLATQSQTSLAQAIGLNIQSLYFEQNNNKQAVKELKDKIKQNISFYQDDNIMKSMALVFFDERLARDWLNLSIEKGERIGVEQLKADAMLYSQNPNYAPCLAVNN